jgi:SET domain-containing protein
MTTTSLSHPSKKPSQKKPLPKKRVYEVGAYAPVVKRSSAGLGLFASIPIPKNACIIEYVGRTISPEEEYTSTSKYLFGIHSRRTIDGRDRSNTARYINHSCTPNCEPEIHKGRVFIFAKRNINAGEELTYNYGKEYWSHHIKPHGCRCLKCMSSQGK